MSDAASTYVPGIDVSHFQGTVDWNQVRGAGIVYAFAKATDGITYTDPQFAANWAGMQQAGIFRGAYHFFEPQDDAASQAANYLAAIGTLGSQDLAPALDVEVTNGISAPVLWAGVQSWLEQVAQATGRTPLLYTNPSFWNGNAGLSALTSYPLWLADYASSPTLPQGWSRWKFWQYSQSGTVAGISGAVDRDYYNGTAAQLLSELGT